MSQGIDLVNVGLDYYFQHQRTNLGKRRTKIVRTITRNTLGRCIAFATGDTYSEGQVSTWLQEYRYAQKDKTMLYRIAARGYGRSARWYILAGPKLDNLDGEGIVVAHAEWVISDAAARVDPPRHREVLGAAGPHRWDGQEDQPRPRRHARRCAPRQEVVGEDEQADHRPHRRTHAGAGGVDRRSRQRRRSLTTTKRPPRGALRHRPPRE
jgi:uncharacterized Rmd1/YagE family protein